MSTPADDLDGLARRFAHLAAAEARAWPLYRRLAQGTAGDRALLALAAPGSAGPKPSLFLAAVHYLLLGGERHPLAAFYPSLGGHPSASADPFPAFRDFCLAHAAELRGLMAARRLQTNEVARSAYLVLALDLVARLTGGLPLAVVEVGASGGLLLGWDRYGYDFGDDRRLGETAALAIPCRLAGARRPVLPTAFPNVAVRAGIDLDPLDVRDPDAARWLRALVWAEQTERDERLRRAIAIVAGHPPTLIAGDALDLLPAVLDGLPPDTAPCILHFHTLYQFSAAARRRFAELLADYSRGRVLFLLSLEHRSAEDPRPELGLSIFARGELADQLLLARCDPLGGRLEWLGPASVPLPDREADR